MRIISPEQQRGEESLEAESPRPYSRFRIETEATLPLYPEPNRYEPKVSKGRLARLLLQEFNRYFLAEAYTLSNWKKLVTKKFYRDILDGEIRREVSARWKTFLDRPCIYGVFSGRFGGFRPIKDRCTACMRCKQEYPEVIEDVTLGKEFRAMNQFGLKPEDFHTLSYEAREGKELVKGMGYRGRFAGPGWDSIWLDMSEIVRPTRDGKMGREYISTSVDIGKRSSFIDFHSKVTYDHTISIEIPVLFDISNDDWVSDHLRIAVVEAARRCGTLALVTLKSYLSLSQEDCLKAIPIITLQEIPRLSSLSSIPDMIEVEVSPSSSLPHNNFRGPRIVIARIRADEIAEELSVELVKKGYDGVHTVADSDGLSSRSKKRHVKDAIRAVHTRLVREGVRDQVTIFAGGGINIAEHLPKAILCGCDAVSIDIPIYAALQAEFKRYDEDIVISPRKIGKEWGAQRVTNLMAAWHEQFIEALSAMGKRDGRRLRGDVGRGIFYDEMVKEAFGDIEVAPISD